MPVVETELPFRPPMAVEPLLGWFRARAIDGVVEVVDRTLRRTLDLPGGPARVALTVGPVSVQARFELSDAGDRRAALDCSRRLLDLDADPAIVDAHLAADPALRPLVRARPGLRVPGSADPNEMAVLTVIGQQISTAAARTIASRLVDRLTGTMAAVDGVAPATGGAAKPALGVENDMGGRVDDPQGDAERPGPGPTRWFPSAAVIAEADLDGLGMPRRRAATVQALAAALADGHIDLSGAADPGERRARLLALPGVGPWTADYISLRAVGDRDALPATDLVLRQRAAERGIELAVDSAAWRPWRAYAAQHLWVAEARSTDPAGPPAVGPEAARPARPPR